MMPKDKLRQLTGDERLGQMRESEYLGAEDIDDDVEPVLTIAGLWNGTVTKPSGVGSNYSSAAPSAASAVSIPMLAKGAVIPPNAPFLAVLGDQRRGTNVEAPLSTIQEAVAAVMEDNTQGMMRGFEALLQENRMLRDAVENIRIGDDTLGRAVDRYTRRKNVMMGGCL